MADGINKTNNTVVAPDIGNMVKAFVQNETVQKVADVYMAAIKRLNPTPPQHYRGFTEIDRQVGTIRRVLDEALVANGLDRAAERLGLESEHSAIMERLEHGHATININGIMWMDIAAKPQATEIVRMLYPRGFGPTGNEKVKVLIGGLINMFTRHNDQAAEEALFHRPQAARFIKEIHSVEHKLSVEEIDMMLRKHHPILTEKEIKNIVDIIKRENLNAEVK